VDSRRWPARRPPHADNRGPAATPLRQPCHGGQPLRHGPRPDASLGSQGADHTHYSIGSLRSRGTVCESSPPTDSWTSPLAQAAAPIHLEAPGRRSTQETGCSCRLPHYYRGRTHGGNRAHTTDFTEYAWAPDRLRLYIQSPAWKPFLILSIPADLVHLAAPAPTRPARLAAPPPDCCRKPVGYGLPWPFLIPLDGGRRTGV